MIYVIAEPCHGTCDTSCVDVCPVDCIHGPLPLEEIRKMKSGGNEMKLMLYIDPEECISCGACEPECPVDAIFEDEELPAKWSNYAALNADFFKTRTK
jgi:NAD-dependent dihydropyrimidine dehydrogenase PreA subunit